MIRSAVRFHGHLGPYLVLGMRIGILAKKILEPKGIDELFALVWTKRSPPQSCVIDGIQISSGCTVGKGNIRVRAGQSVKACFERGNRSIRIQPTEKTTMLLSNITGRDSQEKLRHLAFQLNSLSDRDLLSVSEIRKRRPKTSGKMLRGWI